MEPGKLWVLRETRSWVREQAGETGKLGGMGRGELGTGGCRDRGNQELRGTGRGEPGTAREAEDQKAGKSQEAGDAGER